MFVYIERVISIMCTVTERKNNKNNDNNNDNSNDINESHRNRQVTSAMMRHPDIYKTY